MVTIKDIAELAGVAKSTVSRYLNNGQVSAATRQKIESIIEETGYRPNTFARSLKAQHSFMIGVIIPRLNSPSTNDVLAGIDETARNLGYQLIITNSNQDDARELENIEMLIKQKVAGIILFARELNEELQARISESPIPVLVLGQELKGVHSIVHEDYLAGKKMAEYALSLGHQHFLFVGVTAKDHAVGVLRKKGFVDEVSKYGYPIDIIETTFSRKEAYHRALRYLPENKATYIACATDNIAVAVLKAAHELHFQVPEDFSLSGFGGYDATDFVHPTITTVIYPYRSLGICAIQNLQRLIQHDSIPYRIELTNQLIIKSSTEKAPHITD